MEKQLGLPIVAAEEVAVLLHVAHYDRIISVLEAYCRCGGQKEQYVHLSVSINRKKEGAWSPPPPLAFQHLYVCVYF